MPKRLSPDEPSLGIAVVMPAGEYDHVRRLAWQHRMTLSQFTRRLVVIGLQHLDDDALPISGDNLVSSRPADGQGNAAENGE